MATRMAKTRRQERLLERTRLCVSLAPWLADYLKRQAARESRTVSGMIAHVVECYQEANPER